MKTSTKIILTTLAFVAMTAFVLRSPAQFIQGPNVKQLLTNPAAIPFIAVGGGTAPGPSTNLSGLAVQNAVVIGSAGFALGINAAGTNATTTTNLTVELEFSADGVNYATNNRQSVIWTPLGVQWAPNATNLSQFSAVSGGILGNMASVRVRSLHHTNTGSIFITNLTVSTR